MKKLSLLILMSTFTFLGFSQIIINEFCASNKSIADPQFGKFSDWIELFNPDNQDVDLTGFYLTDKASEIKKWTIPANVVIPAEGFLVLWADGLNSGLHTNFSLAADGEFIGLATPSGVYIDSLTYDIQKTDISYGRIDDGAMIWGFFSTPTLGTSNNLSSVVIKTAKPLFSLAPGVYSGSQTATIAAESGAKVYYTTNGSTPTNKSTVYNGAITLNNTTILKAIALKSGEDESDVAASTFFINEHTFDLPILSISTDPNWLFNADSGIYELGPKADTTQPHYGANYWLDKEIPMTFQYYSPTGAERVNVEGGAKIYGGYSRVNDIKSMQFKAKSKYGASMFHYQFFKDKNIIDFKNIGIRNSGNDYGGTMFRDAFMQQLTKKYMKIDYQETQHVAFFINGNYFGLTMLIEKLNENYIASNYNIDPNNVDLLDAGPTVLNGDFKAWNEFENYYTKTDLSSTTNYNHIKTMMDMDEYIDYMIAELYYSNTDWPGNNMKYWRERKTDAKWRWILYDTDFGFGPWGSDPCANPITFITDNDGPSWPNPPHSTLLFRNLLTNQSFKNEFIQRFAYQMTTSFDSVRVNKMIDSISTSISNEMTYQIARWSHPGSITDWQGYVNEMKHFGLQRGACVQDHIKNYFGITGMADVTIKNDTAKGNVYLASKKLDTLHSGTYFKDIAIPISAIARDGFAFKYWKKTEYNSSSTISSQTLIAKNATWNYLDNGTDQGTTWIQSTFNDASWKSANGIFGYSEPNITTIIDYGGNASNKYITTYFRKKMTVINPNEFTSVTLRLMRGDDAIVYINGVETIRSNMPTGTIGYQTTAFGATETDEMNYLDYTIPVSAFIKGENTIAVEVHQTSITSSDLSFDMELVATTKTITTSILVDSKDYNKDLQLVLQKNVILEPVYQKLIPLVITEFQNQSDKGLQGQFIELYNAGNYTIDLSKITISGDVAFSFPANSTIPKSEFIIICKDTTQYASIPTKKYDWTIGQLASAGIILMKDDVGDTVDYVSFQNAAPWPINTASSNVSIELIQSQLDNNIGNNWQLNPIVGGTPVGFPIEPIISNIYINECMSNNSSAFVDDNGYFSDWIELYNAGTTAVNVAGLYLTDSDLSKAKYRIPDTDSTITTIQPRGFLTFRADSKPQSGILHTNFNLSKGGETVYLYQVNYHDSLLIDKLSLPSLDTNTSYGRYPDGSNTFHTFLGYTPLASNTLAVKVSGLYLNEVMPLNNITTDEAGEFDSWVEIYNSNAHPVNVAGLFLTNNSVTKNKWIFPTNDITKTTIPGYSHRLVWLDNEPSDGTMHANFTIPSNNGYLALYQQFSSDTNLLSDINYTITKDYDSYGRYPSGSKTFYEMQKATPRTWNSLASLTFDKPESDNIECSIYPIPMTSILHISSSRDVKRITIYTIEGKIALTSFQSSIDVSLLNAGMYIVEIKTDNGVKRILTIKQ